MTFYLAIVDTKDLKKLEELGAYKMAEVEVRNSSAYISSQYC